MSQGRSNVWKLRDIVNVLDPAYGAKGDNSTDDTTAIQSAITAGAGRIVYLPKPSSKYKVTNTLNLTSQYTKLVGESRAAILSFQPAGALTNGILKQAFDVWIENLQIEVNANVVNGIRVSGNGSRGGIEGCLFAGSAGTAGQRGIYIEALTPATYFHRIVDCDINNFETGIRLDNEANAQFIDRIQFGGTFQTGIYCDTTLNNISNVFGQTPGLYVFDFGPNGQLNCVSNISGESNTRHTMHLTAGARFNMVTNVHNSGSGGVVHDESAGVAVNNINRIDSGDTGQILPTPTVVNSEVYNTYGTRIQVVINVGATNTNVNRRSVFLRTCNSELAVLTLDCGEWFNISQTVDVSWTFWRI